MRSNSYCLFGGKECGNVGSPNSKRFHKVLRLTRDALGAGTGSAAQKQDFQTYSSVTEECGGLTWKSLRNGEPKHTASRKGSVLPGSVVVGQSCREPSPRDLVVARHFVLG